MSRRVSMSNYPHPLIAKEGWGFIALAVFFSLLVTFACGVMWALPLWGVSLFVLQFFRDPPREVPPGERNVLSPADGRVISIEPVEDPYLQRRALKISVFMNVFNVHSNRAPVAGVVKQRWYSPGSFVNASLDKASSHNERNALWIQTPAGQDITCVQVAGLIARRILCYVEPGATLAPGQRTVRPVLGGSGTYDGASGQVVSTNLGADGWTHVFRITLN